MNGYLLTSLLAIAGTQAESPTDSDASSQEHRYPIADVIGRVQLDLSEDAPFGDDIPTDRRIRLGVTSQFSSSWGGVVDVDFAGGSVAEQDVFIWYQPAENHRISFGHTKVPSVLDEKADDLFSTFLERATFAQFSPGYAVGISYAYANEGWNAEIGLFGTDRNGDSFVLDSDGTQIGARFGRLHALGDNGQFHLGVSGHRADLSDHTMRDLSLSPEINSDAALLQISLPDPDQVSFLGLEAAVTSGLFSLQSELGSRRFTSDTAANIEAEGGYVEATFMLSGERRILNESNSTFQRVNVRRPLSVGGHGAWQFGARYSTTRMDQAPSLSNELTSFSLALNWYPEHRVRVMFNWVNYDTASVDFIPASMHVQRSGSASAVRFQVDW